ncbi:MAG: TatD family hydrolase [Oscillospiraceae bacterium]|nr:TatD family hydrolase [Oscillospiraceae bacterium]
MYIDFHVHAFDDRIAQRAMSSLTETAAKTGIGPCTDGTVNGLMSVLRESRISRAVLLPVATKPTQQKTINNWAASLNNDFFCPFGSVHPDAPDVFEELERIKSLNLYGVKFHPDYQNFFVDDEKMFPIYKKCAQLDLPVLIHAGYDPLSPDIIHCMPDAAARAFDAVNDMTMILAHGGGMYHWDMVEKYLCGKEGRLFFDVSVISRAIEKEQLFRIIKKHGAPRILFGSDCPWDDPANEIMMINDLELSQEEKDLIFYKNAQKLLKI